MGAATARERPAKKFTGLGISKASRNPQIRQIQWLHQCSKFKRSSVGGPVIAAHSNRASCSDDGPLRHVRKTGRWGETPQKNNTPSFTRLRPY